MSKISKPDVELRAVGINPETINGEWDNEGDSYLSDLGIKYIGQQERFNNFPLDAFIDLATGSVLLRGLFESVEDMVRRVRKR